MRRWLIVSALAVAAFGPGCSALVATEEPTPTPVPARIDEGKQTYEVQRGSIFDTIKALGRIVSKDETPLYFKQDGRLRSVNVDVMQPVKKGDLLAELDTADLPSKVQTARIQMEIAQIEVSRQVANAQNVKSDTKAAAASVVAAQAAVTRASNDLARLEAGPLPADAAVAEAAVNEARAKLGRAEAQAALLRKPPPQEEEIAARAAVDKTRSILQKAQADYDKIAWRPDAKGTAQAVALQQATADYEAAVSNLKVKTTGTKPEDIQAADRAVESARESLRGAEARLEQLRAGARRQDLDATRAAVAKANAALSESRAAFEATAANERLTVTDFDVAMAQKQVALARVKFEGLQDEMEAARVRAPFDGIITFITGKQGDKFDAFAPIAIISNPARLEVSAEFASADMARIEPGQEAIVTTEAFGTTQIRGKVLRLPTGDSGTSTGPQSTGNPKAVRISFDPPRPGAVLGQLAQVTVIAQQKDNIILIPNTAVRRFGTRSYVQVIGPDGRRRDQDVEVGLVTETESEIKKGLREGQRVIVQ